MNGEQRAEEAMAEISPLKASQEAHKIHRRGIFVDLHHDIAEDVIRRRELGEEHILRRIWLPRLESAGIKVQVFPIYLDSGFLPEMALRRELAMIHYLLEEIDENLESVVLARDYPEIEAGLRENKLVAILALEGAEAIDRELTILGILHRVGVRMASLTWNRRTIFADGADQRNGSGGLTGAGIEIIRRMEKLKMLVDVSHLSEAGFWNVVEIAERPFVASHSNARALCDHPRNLTDDQCRAIRDHEGLLGIFIHPAVIDPSNPTIARVVDHIAYLADLVGSDHVGIGTDFIADLCGIDQTPTQEWMMPPELAHSTSHGLAGCADLPSLTDELMRRGFATADIHKILGGNAMRVFRSVWSA
jgi:membrane dipeptidase